MLNSANMKKPVLYILAFFVATLDCLHGECTGTITDDGPELDVQYFGDTDAPVLMFIDKCRPTPNFLVGWAMEEDSMITLLDKCWKQYYEQENLSQRNLGEHVHKPHFLETFRYVIGEEQRERENHQRMQWAAEERAEQVRRWLNAGADVNAVVLEIPDRRYNLCRGCTALTLAKSFHDDKIIRMLSEHGAK